MSDIHQERAIQALQDAADYVEAHPEERDQWAVAFIMGHVAGFLGEYTGPDEDVKAVRPLARIRLLEYIDTNPDSTSLERVRQGTGYLKDVYVEGVVGHPCLEWDLGAVVAIDHMVKEDPRVTERVAQEILERAGI